MKPLIDRSYPLEQVAEAHRYVDTGRKRGNIAITVAHHTERQRHEEASSRHAAPAAA